MTHPPSHCDPPQEMTHSGPVEAPNLCLQSRQWGSFDHRDCQKIVVPAEGGWNHIRLKRPSGSSIPIKAVPCVILLRSHTVSCHRLDALNCSSASKMAIHRINHSASLSLYNISVWDQEIALLVHSSTHFWPTIELFLSVNHGLKIGYTVKYDRDLTLATQELIAFLLVRSLIGVPGHNISLSCCCHHSTIARSLRQ